jgi:signal transduction histidine kinase
VARSARFASTTAFKLSAIYLLVFTAFAVVFVFSITYAANQLFNQQISDTIENEFLDLSIEWNGGGQPALIAAIEQRMRRPGASLYLLADVTGAILAGNVSEVETEFLARAVQSPAEVTYHNQEGEEHVAMVQVARLPGGRYLLIGRDAAERQRFTSITRTALLIAGGLLLGLGLVSWFFVSRRVLRRIDSISGTTVQIMAGDLSGRLEVTGTNDEFDRLAASVNAMLERIEFLLRGLKEVSDNIAHDLKTPLTRMRTRLETVLSEPADEPSRQASIRAIIEDADQLITTFNALLTIARIEAGALEDADDEVDAAVLVRDVVELYEPTAEEAGVKLVVDGAESLPFRGNRELLSQALANLIDNAIKHGRPADNGAARISVATRREGDDIVIAVSDNGPGIPDTERGRVVQRFVRLEKSRSTPGTGLGLSLAEALVKLHRGSLVFADNAPGLVATIRLPAGGMAAA